MTRGGRHVHALISLIILIDVTHCATHIIQRERIQKSFIGLCVPLPALCEPLLASLQRMLWIVIVRFRAC